MCAIKSIQVHRSFPWTTVELAGRPLCCPESLASCASLWSLFLLVSPFLYILQFLSQHDNTDKGVWGIFIWQNQGIFYFNRLYCISLHSGIVRWYMMIPRCDLYSIYTKLIFASDFVDVAPQIFSDLRFSENFLLILSVFYAQNTVSSLTRSRHFFIIYGMRTKSNRDNR